MTPSREQIDWIKAFVAEMAGHWGNPTAAIVAAANEPTIDNPTPQPTRPKPYTLETLMAHLDATAIGKLRSLPSLERLLDRIEANDRVNCARWLTLLAAAGDITADQKAALQAVLEETEPDPTWPPRISPAERYFGRLVTHEDVQEARP